MAGKRRRTSIDSIAMDKWWQHSNRQVMSAWQRASIYGATTVWATTIKTQQSTNMQWQMQRTTAADKRQWMSNSCTTDEQRRSMADDKGECLDRTGEAHLDAPTTWNWIPNQICVFIQHNFRNGRFVIHKHKHKFVFVYHKHKINFGNAPIPTFFDIQWLGTS